MIYYYIMISIITFLVWGYDKFQARSNGWRISERQLIILTLAGGAFGALLGMQIFRHKTRKPAFWGLVIAGCLFHAAVLYLV